ncbi:LCP family protein [Anaerobacillus sp. HL2]|nr:LCP family protein [Anaerobacillus sp. HL2]
MLFRLHLVKWTVKTAKMLFQLKRGNNYYQVRKHFAYARMRKKDPRGDVGRGERQQQILTAIIQEVASLKSITKFDDVIDSVGKNLATNLSFGNIVSLHSYSTGLKNIESLH